jgi:DNA-directed RNA polymerase subunit RPC12/RpoP
MREVLLKCFKCHKEYPSSDMRYVSTNILCCKNCLDRGASISPSPKESLKLSEPKVNKTEYQCRKCKYTFKSNTATNTCPYCGKRDTLVILKSVPASNLIDESSNKAYDW